ncbi:MAG: recombinase family protein [Planctomycetes bacterium]|nr:recombinase family protein [Planctomycetota bacterium]
MARTRPDPDPTKAIGYARASTSRQDLSPGAQRAAVEAWAAARGVTVVAWFEDLGISGGAELDKRPGLLGAIDALRTHGAGALVVARRDRLARDVLVNAMVERLCERVGARVQSADGAGNGAGPEAALMRNIVAAFSAYERMLIRARTKAALALKRERGERTGTVRYGYRVADDGKTLLPDDHEQAVIARARELRAEGASLRAVGRTLLAEGMAPRKGRAWNPQVIHRMTT